MNIDERFMHIIFFEFFEFQLLVQRDDALGN